MKSWQEEGKGIKFCLIGQKSINFFKRHGGEVLGEACSLGDSPTVMDTVGVVQTMIQSFLSGQVDQVYVAYNRFQSIMTHRPTVKQLLPLSKGELANKHDVWDYIYEPDAKEVLDVLFNRYIESQVYQSVIENIACEQASRMIAMKNATDNAQKVIDDLKLLYNKARQAAITQELAEITAGADAIDG